MGSLRLVLGDQLTRSLTALADTDPERDVVLMLEVAGECTYVPHHPQKIAFVLSAMRHFASELRAEGLKVDYVELDDPANCGTLAGEVQRAVARHAPVRLVVTEPGEWRVLREMRGWQRRLPVPVEIRDDDRFFATRERFARWADGRKSLRMEYFYRALRRETGLLMRGGRPEGGKWNFDAENRKRLPADARAPVRRRFAPDTITRQVLQLVGRRFADHFGDLEPFGWAVTRSDACAALEDFLSVAMAGFGDYQDAMRSGAPFLHHSLLSPYLNSGLLTAAEACARAQAHYRAGRAPLNAVEGFIRQVLGWREYVRGVYWSRMPAYAASNALAADRPLPALYWTGETDMNCMAQVIADTRRHAYAHHIQRLMVTGNFALLAGLRPQEVERWYLAVYLDAFEWVELPNTHGMALYADGGLLASKPYAASGAYINRMSDYCAGCRYDVRARSGPRACPFNYLYWGFLLRNERALSANPRLAMPYRTLRNWAQDERQAIARKARGFLARLD